MSGRDDSADEQFNTVVRWLDGQPDHGPRMAGVLRSREADLRRQLAEARAENEQLTNALGFSDVHRKQAEAALAEAHRKLDEARDALSVVREQMLRDSGRLAPSSILLVQRALNVLSSRPAAPVADDEAVMNVNDSSGEPVGVRVHSGVKADEPACYVAFCKLPRGHGGTHQRRDKPATCEHGKTFTHEHIPASGIREQCPGPVSSTAAQQGTGSYDQPEGRR